MPENSLCRWSMSSGLVCSIPNTQLTNGYSIVVFQHLTPRQRIQAAYWLLNIFQTDFRDQHITTIPSCISFILEHWKNGDSLYILLDTKQFVAGGAAIDMKHNEPFISNIFTVPSARNKGFGRILMRYCENYSAKMGFTYAKLWCDEDLIQYYTKQSYVLEKKQLNSRGEMVHIMTKHFNL